MNNLLDWDGTGVVKLRGFSLRDDVRGEGRWHRRLHARVVRAKTRYGGRSGKFKWQVVRLGCGVLLESDRMPDRQTAVRMLAVEIVRLQMLGRLVERKS